MKVQIVLVVALVAYTSAAPSDPTTNTTIPATVTTTKAANTTAPATVTTTKAANTTAPATVTTTPAPQSNTTATNPSNTTSGASSLVNFSSLTIALFALGKYFM